MFLLYYLLAYIILWYFVACCRSRIHSANYCVLTFSYSNTRYLQMHLMSSQDYNMDFHANLTRAVMFSPSAKSLRSKEEHMTSLHVYDDEL